MAEASEESTASPVAVWRDAPHKGAAAQASTDPGHASFEPARYWRGPVWAVVIWMIATGIADAENTTMATRIRDDTRRPRLAG